MWTNCKLIWIERYIFSTIGMYIHIWVNRIKDSNNLIWGLCLRVWHTPRPASRPQKFAPHERNMRSNFLCEWLCEPVLTQNPACLQEKLSRSRNENGEARKEIMEVLFWNRQLKQAERQDTLKRCSAHLMTITLMVKLKNRLSQFSLPRKHMVMLLCQRLGTKITVNGGTNLTLTRARLTALLRTWPLLCSMRWYTFTTCKTMWKIAVAEALIITSDLNWLPKYVTCKLTLTQGLAGQSLLRPRRWLISSLLRDGKTSAWAAWTVISLADRDAGRALERPSRPSPRRRAALANISVPIAKCQYARLARSTSCAANVCWN